MSALIVVTVLSVNRLAIIFQTPVIEAIGEAMMDEKLFPDPAL